MPSKDIITICQNTTYNKLLFNKELKFEELCKIIRDEKVKDMSRLFLKGIFGKTRIPLKVEIFLSLFLIYRFHEVVFEGSGTTMDQNLLNIVKELIDILSTDILNNRNLLADKLDNYREKFHIWKQMDLNQQLKLYCETYYELDILKMKMTQTKEASAVYSDSIIPLQNKIKGVIKYLAGDKGIDYLNGYKKNQLQLTVKLEKSLRENLKKAFWSRLQLDLLNNPPTYIQIPGLFKDIRKMYLSVIEQLSQPNKSKLSKEFDEIVDIEYITMKVEHGGLTENDLLVTGINILEQLKQVGIPSNDKKIDTMILKINKHITVTGKNKEIDTDIFPELVDMFQLIMSILEELQRYFLNKMINEQNK